MCLILFTQQGCGSAVFQKSKASLVTQCTFFSLEIIFISRTQTAASPSKLHNARWLVQACPKILKFCHPLSWITFFIHCRILWRAARQCATSKSPVLRVNIALARWVQAINSIINPPLSSMLSSTSSNLYSLFFRHSILNALCTILVFLILITQCNAPIF